MADWNFDRVLAAHGLACLALTPNKVTMLDQDIGPLGLKYADGNPPAPISRSDMDFLNYAARLKQVSRRHIEARHQRSVLP